MELFPTLNYLTLDLSLNMEQKNLDFRLPFRFIESRDVLSHQVYMLQKITYLTFKGTPARKLVATVVASAAGCMG